MNANTSIKETLFKEKGFVISVVKTNQFNSNTVAKYKKIFDTYKSEGRLINCLFNDLTWTLVDVNGSMNKSSLDYTKTLKTKECMIALKCLSLDMIDTGYSDTHVSKLVSTVSKALQLTNGFSSKEFKKFTGMFDECSDRKKEDIQGFILKFMSFYSKDEFKEYKTYLEGATIKVRNVRKLPEYEEILEFDYIINDFYSNISKDNPLYLKFYPFLIWWRLTTIIPLRPDEFVDLKYDCIKSDSRGNLIISVPRKKKNFNKQRIPVINELKISKEMYNIINEYKDLQLEDEKSEYLFSYKTYLRSLYLTSNKKNSSECRRNRVDKIGRSQIETLQDHFYAHVVKGIYKSDISVIALGDTRHFAFCNMMMQGLNPLSIARIGGHDNINSQDTYVSHLDTYAKSKVRVMSKIIKHNRIKDLGYHFSTSETYDNLIIRSKLSGDTSGYISIQDGYCTDKFFPDNCIEDCDYCNKYIVDISKPECLERLKSKQDNLNKEISIQIETMRNISDEILLSTNKDVINIDRNEVLLNLGNKLNYLFNRQATISANISLSNQFKEENRQ